MSKVYTIPVICISSGIILCIISFILLPPQSSIGLPLKLIGSLLLLYGSVRINNLYKRMTPEVYTINTTKVISILESSLDGLISRGNDITLSEIDEGLRDTFTEITKESTLLSDLLHSNMQQYCTSSCGDAPYSTQEVRNLTELWLKTTINRLRTNK